MCAKGREGKGRKEGRKGRDVSFGLAWGMAGCGGWVGMFDWRLGGIGVGVGVGVVDVDGGERRKKQKKVLLSEVQSF